jgi:uncharacterized membrane protein YjgN (DUF898 family)
MTDVTGAAPAARELPFEFRATGAEYFRIWIVNLLLSIVTLGIYSAWAKVRRLRYFYGSTSLEGSSFEYHGSPRAILRGRVIVVLCYLVFVGITRLWPWAQIVFLPLVLFGVPWVIVRARLFQMRMTSWRGLRFNFHGQYGGALAAYVGWPLLSVLSLGVLWPYALWKQAQFLVTHGAYGAQRFGFTTRAGTYFRFCFIGLAIAVGVGIVAIVVVGFFAGAAATRVIGPGGVPAPADPRLAATFAVTGAVVAGLVALFSGAYFRVRFVNASVGGATIGPHALRSQLRFWPYLGITLTNLLAMIVTLGLFYPWARVRLMRYQLAHTSVLAHGDTGQFIASADTAASAVGEEASDFFDIDFAI